MGTPPHTLPYITHRPLLAAAADGGTWTLVLFTGTGARYHVAQVSTASRDKKQPAWSTCVAGAPYDACPATTPVWHQGKPQTKASCLPYPCYTGPGTPWGNRGQDSPPIPVEFQDLHGTGQRRQPVLAQGFPWCCKTAGAVRVP